MRDQRLSPLPLAATPARKRHFEIPLRKVVEKEQTKGGGNQARLRTNRTGRRATDCHLFILTQVRFASPTGYSARIIIR